MSTSVSLYTDDKELSAFLSKIDKLNKFIIDQNEKPWLNLNHNGTWVALPSGTSVPFGPPIVSMFCFDLMCKCCMFFGCNKKAMLCYVNCLIRSDELHLDHWVSRQKVHDKRFTDKRFTDKRFTDKRFTPHIYTRLNWKMD